MPNTATRQSSDWFCHRTMSALSVCGLNAAAEAVLTPAPFPCCTMVAVAADPWVCIGSELNQPLDFIRLTSSNFIRTCESISRVLLSQRRHRLRPNLVAPL